MGGQIPVDVRYPNALLDLRLQDAFWARVKKRDGCHLWVGPRSKDGYGRFRFTYDGRHLEIAAHRAAHVIVNGKLEANQVVRHLCRNRRCVRADHLQAGTTLENALDRLAHKVTPTRRLSMAQARQIRVSYRTQSMRQLAVAHGVSVGTVSRIIRHETYREPTGDNEHAPRQHPGTPINRRRRSEYLAIAKAIRTEFAARHAEGRGLIANLARKYGIGHTTARDIILGRGGWLGVVLEGVPGPWPEARYNPKTGGFDLDGSPRS